MQKGRKIPMASGSKIICCILLGLIFASTLLDNAVAQETEGSPQTAAPPETETEGGPASASPPETEGPDAAPDT
ncbi:hypothetical protein SUGI_0035660 [Cryptomeria japonica]|nr:hypothetical protein SUGI_0035660 [Cryptomeria japonica]